jgi:hypothetical protein
VEEGQAEARLNRRRPKVTVDALENRGQPGKLPGRVEIDQILDEAVAALEDGEAVANPGPDSGVGHEFGSPAEIHIVRRRVALFATADLVPADDAAIVLAGRTGRFIVAFGSPLPDQLVENDRPAARPAAAAEGLADRELETRIAARRCGQRLESCV